MAHEAVERVIPNQIRTAVLAETIDRHVDKQFEAGKATEDLQKRMLRNDD